MELVDWLVVKLMMKFNKISMGCKRYLTFYDNGTYDRMDNFNCVDLIIIFGSVKHN